MRNLQIAIAGAIVGLCIGLFTSYEMAKPPMEHALQAIQDCNAENSRLREENERLKSTLAGFEHATQNLLTQRAETQKTFSEGTVLYEETPANYHSGGGSVSSILLDKIVSDATPARMLPRWFIPAHVKPIVYGDAGSVRVLYVDAQGRTTPGAPEILPQ